ncbi:MAG TPA: exodeoxyribonuclease V subunit alpha [Geobacteraceae bacterium]
MMTIAREHEMAGLDRHFARFICRLAGTGDEHLRQLVELLVNAVADGHVCLDLAAAAADPASAVAGRPVAELAGHLRSFPVVGTPGAFTPLVLDDSGRLYLYRYWRDEHDLACLLRERGGQPAPVDEAALRAGLARLFPPPPAGEMDWQQVAAVAAVRSRVCVISGGPGTGKTSTVVKVVALLLDQPGGGKLRVALAAPTGKAAARLLESLRSAREKLALSPDLLAAIPDEVATLHRLLGMVPGTGDCRYHAGNPLPCDLVVVDEASMVAMPLMAKLVRALRPGARLLLLGDRDQLASVEAGAVLGDICAGRAGRYSAEFAGLAARVCGVQLPVASDASVPPLTNSLVVLEKSYRFAVGSVIDQAGRLVNMGDGEAVLTLLAGDDSGSVSWHDLPPVDRLEKALAPAVCAGFAPCLQAADPAEALRLFGRFRILCALRQGPYGVAELNGCVERILAVHGLIAHHDRWYAGRPLMVTANDYSLKLFNGDAGIVLPDPAVGGALRAFFPSADGGVRAIAPLRLPPHETAFVMTVHKSQGSEFDRLLLMLPDRDTPVITRELLYTALTRARQGVAVWGAAELFRAGVARRVQRNSGLQAALWG